MNAPPRDLPELLTRAYALQHCALEELEARYGFCRGDDPRRSKGTVGALLERALGASQGSLPGPDFPLLGVELKTIPLDAMGRARESTFVCRLALRAAEHEDFESSALLHKLRQVLWMPGVVAKDGARRVGRAFLWRPTPEQLSVLRADYDDLVGMIAIGKIEGLSARVGRCLQVRPKAAHGGIRTHAFNEEGEPIWTIPRGFYLRARFTTSLLRQA